MFPSGQFRRRTCLDGPEEVIREKIFHPKYCGPVTLFSDVVMQNWGRTEISLNKLASGLCTSTVYYGVGGRMADPSHFGTGAVG